MHAGEKIRQLRKRKKMTQQELGDMLGIHVSHVNRMEKGHLQPSIDALKKVTSFFLVSADYILNDEIQDLHRFELKDKTLNERIQLLDKLDKKDREAVIRVIDAMLTKLKIKQFIDDELE